MLSGDLSAVAMAGYLRTIIHGTGTITFAYDGDEQAPNGDIRMMGVMLPSGQPPPPPPPPPPEKEAEAEQVGAYVPPVDVSPTGNTATYDPQPATTASEEWRQHPIAQVETGFLAGVALGLVPFAGIGEQMLNTAGVLPQAPDFRQGLAIGQIFGGIALIVGGATGEVLGGLLTTTGIGAVLGVPAMAVSAGLVTAGLANIGAGFRGLMTTGSGSGSGARGGGEATTNSSRAVGREVKEAERALKENQDFRRWFHREYKADQVSPRGGRTNPDLTPEQVRDAYQEWLESGKPKVK
jgi:hypothetical protein